jgi:hypothetical protein
LWAITDFRTFVLEHLRPWHELCEKNYLLEWDSIYDLGEHRKRRRMYSETEDLMVPSWVAHLSEPNRRNIQCRAKNSLATAIKEHELIKGKALCLDGDRPRFRCKTDGCMAAFGSDTALVDHFRRAHGEEERILAQIRWRFDLRRTLERVKARQEKGIMATDHMWPGWPPKIR